MNCDWQTRLDPYVDAELSGAELEQVQAHLRDCPECAAAALERMQMKRSVHVHAQTYTPRPEFRLKIQQAIESADKPKRAFKFNWLPAFGIAAAALATLLIVSGLWFQQQRHEQVLGELADLHVSTLASASPVDVISTDRHTVKPWFQGKLPFTFNLPELQETPFKLIGGRVTYFEQSPGAQLLFEVRKHQISVFILQERSGLGSGAGPSVSRTLAFTTETWSDGGLRYFVVGDAGAADIHALSELLRVAAKGE